MAMRGEEGLRARSTLLLAREAEEALATGLEEREGRRKEGREGEMQN